MKKAYFIRNVDGFAGDARLYKLSEPAEYFTQDGNREKCNYVIVLAIYDFIVGAETYIFPTDENGKILSWSEMDGSFWGRMNHEKALRKAGYEVTRDGKI